MRDAVPSRSRARNPALAALGCEADARVLIVHADDVGMCEATVTSFMSLAASGAVSSGSVMMPSPWCADVAAQCRGRADLDLGVHLTLTSEWERYRWRPISAAGPDDGLVDAWGYLHPRAEDLWARAAPAAVRREIDAQIVAALRCGLTLTHVDSHMFAVAHGRFARGYVETALAHGLVPLVPRPLPGSIATPMVHEAVQLLEAARMPVVDRLEGMPLGQPDELDGRVEHLLALIDTLPPGLTCLVAHPAADTPELRAIASDWRARIADDLALRDPRVRRALSLAGIRTVGYGDLVRALRRIAAGGEVRPASRPSARSI